MHLALLAVQLLLLHAISCIAAVGRTLPTPTSPATTTASLRFRAATQQPTTVALAAAQTDGQLITCGYLDGNASAPRSAQPGFDCRIDTLHGIWGFCPTTVIAATDCGLAAACSDSGTCTSICEFNAASGLTTITCPSSGTNVAYCSTAMLTFGVDQSYAYVACGHNPVTDHYVATPTFTPTPSTTSSSKLPSTTSTRPSVSSTSSPSTKSPAAQSSSSSSSSLATQVSATKTFAGATVGTSQATSSPSPPPASSSNTNVGAIIGGVLGGLALLCTSAIVVVFIIKRNRSSSRGDRQRDGPSTSTSSPPPPDMSPSTAPFPPASPYAQHAQYAPHLHGMHAGAPPPRPPPATGLPHAMYPNVYHEADSSTEKYNPSSAQSRGYEGSAAYAVELPSHDNF
ncbi:hypothetical protein SPBR_08487 [Sporothrix brasiliensis 5110]|uniref:Uncharacterized protein n=1 Tax=Sporothrix brasiliensis 5110 TaxID=1398154 RepID=A0A0C2IAW4_9PEZI|nr:uncharacterized protein SPBR_08487 [Sporothrix brasiliensis 5110]KIH86391.1 hypothetical protein SPBR_08487 [Sporothrix brasiliensis 5110]